MTRRTLTAAFALAAALCTAPVFAASHKEAPDMKAAASASAPIGAASGAAPSPAVTASGPTTQQNKMATCNKDAEGKKGDERKAFMKECLSTKKATQQDRMKTCNADAKGKKGDERKAFMKECLSAARP